MTTQKSEHEVVVTVSANSHRDAVVFAQYLVGRDDIGRLGVTVVRAVVPEPEDPVVPEILGLLGDLGKRVRGQVTITPKREGEMLIDWGGGVTYLLGDANPAYALISRGLALAADEDAVSETEEGGIK